MRPLLIFPFLSLGLCAQSDLNKTLSISGGYEFHGTYAHGWNITANALHQFDKIPSLHAGFDLGYGISEYNTARSGSVEVQPIQTQTDLATPIYTSTHFPNYTRMERVRFGLEMRYDLIDENKHKFAANHQFAVGLGLTAEALLRYTEYGVRIWTETDSSGTETVYTQEYSVDQRTNEINRPYSLYIVPQISYTYKFSDRLGLFFRTALFARLTRNIRYGGFLQNNVGVNYQW